jgi:hypothetical protein
MFEQQILETQDSNKIGHRCEVIKTNRSCKIFEQKISPELLRGFIYLTTSNIVYSAVLVFNSIMYLEGDL